VRGHPPLSCWFITLPPYRSRAPTWASRSCTCFSRHVAWCAIPIFPKNVVCCRCSFSALSVHADAQHAATTVLYFSPSHALFLILHPTFYFKLNFLKKTPSILFLKLIFFCQMKIKYFEWETGNTSAQPAFYLTEPWEAQPASRPHAPSVLLSAGPSPCLPPVGRPPFIDRDLLHPPATSG
jgi:hypothetical protein